MKIVVLHNEVAGDACLDEADALVQRDVVSQALRCMGHEVSTLPFSLAFTETMRTLEEVRPDCVFNLVETVLGRGSLIHMAPAMLDCLEIPYTGACTDGIYLTSNKVVAKKLLRASGLQTPPWLTAGKVKMELDAGFRECIVKSVWEHASIGLDEGSIVPAVDRERLFNVMSERRQVLGGECFAEAYVDGREFNVSLLAGEDGPQVLPPAEILFHEFPPQKPRVVGYRAKWEPESFDYSHTPRCFELHGKDRLVSDLLADQAKRCWFLFDLRGYARIDFRVDTAGTPWIIDVNANPCLSPDAGFFAASREAGIGFEEIIARILSDMNTFW